MDSKHYIEAAKAISAEIDIIYSSGSRPGAVRRIRPLSLTKGLVRAECEGQYKAYHLAKVLCPEEAITLPGGHYADIYGLLLREQRQIIASGLPFEADRHHMTLIEAGRPLLSIRRSGRQWTVNDMRYDRFSDAAEVFVIALHLLRGRREAGS